MSWNDILKKFGFHWIFKDYFYKFFSDKPDYGSVQNYLNKNVRLAHNLIGTGFPRFKGNRDNIVLKCFNWVTLNIRYKQDKVKWKQEEYWEDLDNVVLTKEGDCESMATLLFGMLRAHNVSPVQVKLVAGIIDAGNGGIGHCWVQYFSDASSKWHVLDPAYYPNEKAFFDSRRTVEECVEYKVRWFEITDKWW